MKLTNYIRDAFVRAAMTDVPTVNYAEQAQVIAQHDALARMPEQVKDIHNNPALAGYINKHVVRLPGDWGWHNHQVAVYAMSDFKFSSEATKKILALHAASTGQTSNNNSLEAKLRAAAYAVTTRKALVDMLPEFEKYLPEDDKAACKTLPAVANLVSDFVKAGWPKKNKPVKPALQAA